jgi:hypothetical protein
MRAAVSHFLLSPKKRVQTEKTTHTDESGNRMRLVTLRSTSCSDGLAAAVKFWPCTSVSALM